jgi:phosphohistidine phosphatase
VTQLTVLRHAKSSWEHPGLDDFDRPLNDRGRKAARRLGRELKHRKIRFDHVIASPAVRVRETIEELAKGYGELPETRFDSQLYGAGAEGLLQVLRHIPETVHAPLLVGHNPGLQELVLALARDDGDGLRSRVSEKFPTAALALIELSAVRWDEVETQSGTIAELILPRELD